MSFYLSEVDSEERLELSSKIILRSLNNPNNAGRKENVPNISSEDKIAIGVVGKAEGIKVAAEEFGVSKQTVQNTLNSKHIKIQEKKEIEDKLASVKDQAVDKILGFLNKVNPENVEGSLKPVRIAKDLSSIVEKVSPKEEAPKNQVQVLIYKPEKLADINNFETIVVNSNPEN